MKKVLLSILISLFVLVPSYVYAEEITSLNIIVDTPVFGESPDSTIDIEFWDSEGKVVYTEKDYPAVWKKVSLDTEIHEEMELTDTFLEGYRYYVNSSDEKEAELMQNLIDAGHTISEDGEIYYNGVNSKRSNHFVINGITSYNVRGQAYEDETLPTSLNVVIESSEGTKELNLNVSSWYLIHKNGEVEYLEPTVISGYGRESGYLLFYYPVLEFPSELEDLIDINTEIRANGEIIETKYSDSRFECFPRDHVAQNIYGYYSWLEGDLDNGTGLFSLKSDYRLAKNYFYTLENFNEEQINHITYHQEIGPDEYLDYAKKLLKEAENILKFAEAIDLFKENKTMASAEALISAYNKYLENTEDPEDIKRFYSDFDIIMGEAESILKLVEAIDLFKEDKTKVSAEALNVAYNTYLEKFEDTTIIEGYCSDLNSLIVEAKSILKLVEAIDLFKGNKTKASAEVLIAAYNTYLEIFDDTTIIEGYYSDLDTLIEEAKNMPSPQPESLPVSNPENTPDNPDTSDAIVTIAIAGGILVIGLVGLALYFKNKLKIND